MWVLISQLDFIKSEKIRNEENRFLGMPYKGKIATKLECYPNTLNPDAIVYTRKIGIRPKIEIVESSNPIFFEQQDGINMKRVISSALQMIQTH